MKGGENLGQHRSKISFFDKSLNYTRGDNK